MKERIKKVRKALKLTQQEFADRLGIKRNTIANYEIGRNAPIDAVLTLICREFNVSESWLRNGEGQMFITADNAIISQMAEKYHLDAESRALVESFLQLPEAHRRILIEAVKGAAHAIEAATQPANPAPPPPAPVHTVEMTEEEYREYMQDKTAREFEKAEVTSLASGA